MKAIWVRRLSAALLATAPLWAGDVAAAPVKVLHDILNAAETGFDPATVQDTISNEITEAIFEPLYTYDYLARPARLVPAAATALPDISADGKTYTIHLKKGQLFAPDAAFGGKARELTMADYVYSWKRLMDPKLGSPHSWLFEGKVVGLDALAQAAAKSGQFNYDSKVAGFEVVDPYTLRIHLTRPDFNLGMILAHEPTAAVAREVVRKYGDNKGEVASNPVGTGFYKLAEWTRGSKIVLDENTGHLPTYWHFTAGSDPDDQRIVRQMDGKRMPQIGRIELHVMTESQSRWLAFASGESDLLWLEGDLAPKALAGGKLRPELLAKGMSLSRLIDPEINYVYLNMGDPVVGGFSKEKIALRRAIGLAYNIDDELQVVQNGQAARLEYPIPPGVVGYDPDYRSSIQYDPVLANKLLDQYGYKKGADGFRTLPDGKPLLIHFASRNDNSGQLQAEFWRKVYLTIGIRMVSDRLLFSDILKAEKECKLQSRTDTWIADYPDGDDFMQTFYGPNIHQANNSCYQNPAFDKLYEASQRLRDGPERNALYHQMARQMEVDSGILMAYGRYRNILVQKGVLGYKKHPILLQEWKYIDLDRSH